MAPGNQNPQPQGGGGNPNQLWVYLELAEPVFEGTEWRSSAMVRVEERGRKVGFEHPFSVYIIFAGTTDKMTDGKTAKGSGRAAFDFTVDEPGKYKFQAQATGADGSVYVSEIKTFTIPKLEEPKPAKLDVTVCGAKGKYTLRCRVTTEDGRPVGGVVVEFENKRARERCNLTVTDEHGMTTKEIEFETGLETNVTFRIDGVEPVWKVLF